MEILKAAMNWAKAEVFSSVFFILFGVIFLCATIGFWQLGKTEFSKAFIIPTLIAGTLLLIIGFGLVYSNKSRIANFPDAYENDAFTFVQSEISRTEKTMKEYQLIVFKVIPIMSIVAALLIIFIDKPGWRVGSMVAIALLAVVVLIDSNANVRIEAYHQQLLQAEKELKN
ncbi:hypothetical protein GCM10009430_45160 [Aquimarina litoralis]|uniref:Uncharacterized protein n=1 Tax=Aquimarina litoralis TaxID=584605 RepID=A0ABN1J8S6_9FLAO